MGFRVAVYGSRAQGCRFRVSGGIYDILIGFGLRVAGLGVWGFRVNGPVVVRLDDCGEEFSYDPGMGTRMSSSFRPWKRHGAHLAWGILPTQGYPFSMAEIPKRYPKFSKP